jgi:protein TonB
MPRVFTLCSVAVHALVIATALLAPLFAIDTLPAPRRTLTFDGVRRISIRDVLPPTPRRRATPAGDGAVAANAAPTVMPRGIAHETGRESAGTSTPAVEAVGVEHGLGDAIGFGSVERMPPPPPMAPPAPIRLHSGMQPPRKLVDVRPVYPAIAQSARVEGIVILEAILDARGHVVSVHVLRSIPLLDQAAISAVSQWTFTPTLLNDVAVPIVMTVTVQFTLQGR